ncbi:NAD(P)-binding domain-containing protein [Gordonia terrae]|uniref:6-phosphogluconate dehydrogenase NADP-binding domain-containing protein n=2 Tax=Gordonia terrae TaxID=2055 RepID=A0AAD0K7R5_9ACTN|nr:MULTISPECIES: NAD(P)-binding domain-containing protein [Gordonia]VTR01806.1 NAD binding domain of 6-phosphogluconate dehydrogenase [Clostridioides difficile]ANY23568.1 hypothetical protein BCM27_12870 [Gordonia terrae]AWO84301.1 hypothetical protein DLJ61_12970 [Gordonia terrae]VTS52814.1 NAD binding domain of 6-phosphogluconate dehydrogenase [Gordonia terrae]GAB42659.1 hypothetical protein GOTRE_021_00060 [Gordonia terrae NBRC 100016]
MTRTDHEGDTRGEQTAHDVTVLGCGLMGAPLVRPPADAGHRVALWNRTHAKAAAILYSGSESAWSAHGQATVVAVG